MREKRKVGKNRMERKMRKNKGAGILAAVTGAFALVCGCAAMFSGMAEAAAAADMGRTERIPTVYNLPAAAQGQSAPEGYSKASYTAVSDPLEYYRDKKPTENDLTQEEAAEIGAQLLWRLFEVRLDGATVYMGYDNGTETFPRAFWSGDVRFGTTRRPEDNCYTFMIDAVTGEGFLATYGRTLSVKVDLGLDASLAKDPGEYMKLAKEFAEKKNLVGGAVKECVYNCQGYSSNDPTITIDVYGVSGERASITFSRYDRAVLGISLDANEKIMEMMQKLWEQNAAEMDNNMAGGITGNAEEITELKAK